MTNEKLWERIERGLINLTPNRQLSFGVHIAERCNLNCKQCSHYSPLAEEDYIDIKRYKQDCDRLSKLFDGEMFEIILLGGEPLLNSRITEIMRITREAFPIGRISVFTNGLLLSTMPEDFWKACKEWDVIIKPTCYPIKVDYDGLKKFANSRGVKYIPFSFAHDVQLKAYPICSLGAHDSSRGTRNFLNCHDASSCATLKNGKMYPCPQAAYASDLKKYFNLDIHLSEKDGVDIYSVKSGDELLEKLSRPIPFCKYCDVTAERICSDWGISKKDRYEWLAFEFTEDDIQYLKTKTPVVYIFGAGERGRQTVTLLKDQEIEIKSVLATRKKQGIDNILGVPIVTLDELGKVEPNSICLVALNSPTHKSEVYPLLSNVGFGDVIPVS